VSIFESTFQRRLTKRRFAADFKNVASEGKARRKVVKKAELAVANEHF